MLSGAGLICKLNNQITDVVAEDFVNLFLDNK
jgi:hypothetical protein